MRRGELWWADLPPPWGRRPVLLLARDEAYDLLSWVVVAPLTTRLRNIPTAVRLDPGPDGVVEPSDVRLDHIQCVRRERLDAPLGLLRDERMRAVDQAIHFALALRSCQ